MTTNTTGAMNTDEIDDARADAAVFPDDCPKCGHSAGWNIDGVNPDIIGKCANCAYLLPADYNGGDR